ncbi:unnamed protein product [Caenorhabditis brenneri]
MSSKPMAYENVKVLLEYLEPNKRIQVGCRCPSIRVAERAAPLRINHLVFAPGYIHVNCAKYYVQIIKKYHVGELSQLGKSGCMYEVDKFGNEVPSDAAIVTPGDVKIGEVRVVENDDHFENLLQEIQRMKTPGDKVSDVLPRHMLPYYYRRHNMVLPFEQLIQVTLEAQREKDTKTELYVHNKPFSSAVKQLGKYLFGGRRGRIHVKEFQVLKEQQVIRLPLGVQFHIEKLNLVGNWRDEMIPIIQNSCYPLKHLQIHNLSLADVSSPVVHSAELLTISSFDECIALLPNRRVRVQISFPKPTPGDFIRYIERWIEKKRSIGTCHEFYFGASEYTLVKNVMEAIFDRFGGELTGTGLLVFPMTKTSKLEVFNKRLRDIRWELKLTVVAA